MLMMHAVVSQLWPMLCSNKFHLARLPQHVLQQQQLEDDVDDQCIAAAVAVVAMVVWRAAHQLFLLQF